MKQKISLLATAGLLPFSLPARADDITYETIASAAEKSTDLSRQALVTIFGDVVTNPFSFTGSSVIGNAFAIFNVTLCGLALFWFGFIGIRKVISAAQAGRFQGASALISILLAFLGIVPTASGWSLSQLIFLWGVSVMGVGGANLIVTQAGNDIAGGYSLTTQPTSASTRTAARGIFEMELCKYAINQSLSDLNSLMKSETGYMTDKPNSTDKSYTFTISNGSGTCGSVELPYSSAKTAVSDSFFNGLSDQDVSGIYEAQKKALGTMINTMDSAAKTFLKTFIERRDNNTGTFEDVESIIQSAASSYESTVQQAINNVNGENTIQEALSEYLDTQGWITLGAWYQTFATANQRLASIANQAPSVTSLSSIGESGPTDLYQAVLAAYRTNLQNTTYTPTALGSGTVLSKDEMGDQESNDAKSLLYRVLKPSFGVDRVNDIVEQLNKNTTSPLIIMKNIGDYTLASVETTYGAYIAAQAITKGAENSAIGWFVNKFTGVATFINKIFSATAPAINFFLLWVFVIGFQLSIFLPAIPFIFWMIAIGNWIVSVLIGCAAGPLWAATHLGVEHDRGSRAAYGYIYLIDGMIRPSLMVLGFIFASVAVVAVGTILNKLFAVALTNIQADSLTGIVSIAGFLMIYARMCTTMVTNIFALQAYMPDYIIAFLGGREAANTYSGMVDSVKGIFVSGGSNLRRSPATNIIQKKDTNKNDDGIKS
ncbi:DotA/TraY family protein [Escherichia coli]|uniref:DotA/TraY family protein n=4 Tax=Escherichia coli TaxID=562 RepID=UPI001CA64506|nr:DotA/TraY family protein [Escherichia coli]MCQ6909695.1 DotA/TraY family protein [Escherichia coli]ULK06730.1 DotA/TraY family protein [Escherichia coli]HBC0661080.1 DotA/TraY family protein [Escherichia coli]